MTRRSLRLSFRISATILPDRHATTTLRQRSRARKLSRARGYTLDIPALDLFLQCLHQIRNALQPLIDRERAAVDFQRLLVVADVLHDKTETGQRAEVARLAAQYFANVAERTAVILFHIVDGGAPVPGFDIFRFDLDDAVEQLDREIEILLLDRGLHA